MFVSPITQQIIQPRALDGTIISKVTNAINMESLPVNYPTDSAVEAQPLLILITTALTNNHSIITRLWTTTHTRGSDRPIYRLRVWTLGRCEVQPPTELSNKRSTGPGGDGNNQKHVCILQWGWEIFLTAAGPEDLPSFAGRGGDESRWLATSR